MTRPPCPTYYYQPTLIRGTGVTVRCALGDKCHGDHLAVVGGVPVHWTTTQAALQELGGSHL